MSTGVKIYYNVVTDTIYDSNGSLFGNSSLTAYFNNHIDIEVNYMADTSSNDPSNWIPWTGLAGINVSSSVSFDNDYIHANRGTSSSTPVGSTEFSVAVTINQIDLNPSGVLVVYKTDGTLVSLPYNGFIFGSSSITFTLEEPITEQIPSGLKVRVPRSLFLKMQDEDVDNSQAHIGKFMFHTYLMSKKILETLDYSDSKSLTGTMEHKIVSEGNVVRTFTFPFTLANLLDYNGQASVPVVGDWASKDYVNSKIITPTIGSPNYRDAIEISDGYTATKSGWIIASSVIGTTGVSVQMMIDGCPVYGNAFAVQTSVIPVSAGSVCTVAFNGTPADGVDYIILKFVPIL